MKLARFVLFAVSVLAFGLLSESEVGRDSSSVLAQGQAPCTVTVKPGESIQKAIDAAKEGAVICLEVGEWREHLTISKSLALRGAGQEQTKIKGAEAGDVIRIKSDFEIRVTIGELTAAEAKGGDGLNVMSEANVSLINMQVSDNELTGLWVHSGQVSLTNSQISDNGYSGLWVMGHAEVSLTGSQILNNKGEGLLVQDWARVQIRDSIIRDNRGEYPDGFGNGLWARDYAEVSLTNSTISNNRCGLWVLRSATVNLTNSEVSSNGVGLDVGNLAQVSLINSTVSGNRYDGLIVSGGTVDLTGSLISSNGQSGIWVWGFARVKVHQSTIDGNGTDPSCQQPGPSLYKICNGITASWESKTTIIESKIVNNTDWGLAAELKKCGYDEDGFNRFWGTGQVTFEGMELEDISGNNTSGNQNGLGNPGNHYWNRPDIPDGQVCLP
jgi:parallel beta-helix repeat protein